MRIKYFKNLDVILFLICLSLSCGQNRIEKIYTTLSTDIPCIPYGDIFLINSLKPSTEEVIELYHRDYNQKRNYEGIKINYRAIQILGFISDQNDEKVIQFLNDIIAADPMHDKVKAINALLRIGGKPLDQMLKNVFSTDNYELQFKGLKFCWMSDDLEDLLIIKKHLLEALEKHPTRKINKAISNNFLPKVMTAIEILNPKNLVETERMLKDMIVFKNPNFSLPAGLDVQWATKMYFISTDDKTKLYDIFLAQKKRFFPLCENITAYCGMGKITENTLFYLYQMGYELTESEKTWMSNYIEFPGGDMFNLFRSSEQLTEYYEFRKKYPYTKIGNGCY